LFRGYQLRILGMPVVKLAIILGLCAIPLFGQAEWPKPNWEKAESLDCRQSDRTVSKTVGKYEIELVPGVDSSFHDPSSHDPSSHDQDCRAYLVDPAGRKTFLLKDWGISIHEGTGKDVFGDGNPSLILEGYSGGAHCCYTYRIASLGEHPVILSPIKNEAPFYVFQDPATQRYRIMTSDGAFDYFDGLCHACAPMPRVVLEADRRGLHDVSPQFAEQYDGEIALARAKIGEGDMEKFLTSDFADAKGTVLEIVFSYLYSGREAEAWQALDEMWPAADRERVKQLILKTRGEGILARIRKTRPDSPAQQAR